MTLGALFAIAFAAFLIFLFIQTRRAGPVQVEESAIRSGRIIREVRREDAGNPWGKLGIKTSANGLDLKFDHDDDPQAEATLYVPGLDAGYTGGGFSTPFTVRLTEAFRTHHAHNSGFVFQVSLRGAPGVIGKEIRIKMVVRKGSEPVGGQIENDDDTDAAVGDWIEIERAAIIQL